MSTNAIYDSNQEPLCISKSILDLFLDQTEEKPSDLIGIYCFYYYTAKWQQTNCPKATTGYVAKGLQISAAKVQRLKKVLIDLKLVKDVSVRSEDNSRIIGHYILVNFMWGKENTTPLFLQGVENLGGNALSVNRLNALSTNTPDVLKKKKPSKSKPTAQERNEQYLRQAKKLSALISKHKNIKHTSHQLKQWAKDFRLLHEKNGVDPKRQNQVLHRYAKIYGMQYVPEAESGSTFRHKFTKIESAIDRASNPKNRKIVGQGTTKYDRKPDQVINV